MTDQELFFELYKFHWMKNGESSVPFAVHAFSGYLRAKLDIGAKAEANAGNQDTNT